MDNASGDKARGALSCAWVGEWVGGWVDIYVLNQISPSPSSPKLSTKRQM